MNGITDEDFAKFFNSWSLETTNSVDVENILCSCSSIFVGGNIFRFVVTCIIVHNASL